LKPSYEFYCFTDQKSSLGRSDLDVARALIQGGATALQYRAKVVTAREQLATAIQLRALTEVRGVCFIVNDRVDLAVACGADGVHLGQDDLPVSAARLMVGSDLLVGVSTHTVEQALRAEADGADYIGCGPVYATQTKENNVPPVGVELLREVLVKVKIPVVAIGGIKERHFAELATCGARNIAVVTALTSALEVEKAARSMKQKWLQEKTGRQQAEQELRMKSSRKVAFL
jgi:thiamine-phosphate pyrophosphorylase